MLTNNSRNSARNLRDHLFLGSTQSLCPECLELVQAKIVSKNGRVYFDKFCTKHGHRLDFVCSDVHWWDRMEFNVPGREPINYGVIPQRGCPYDCGLCTAHEQHTCVAVLEITSSCNLFCPMCYASSGPNGHHLSLAECRTAIERLIEVEGQAEILQLSGGEPTIHPEFAAIFKYACQSNIDLVMINTNGIRLAHDDDLCELLAEHRTQCQVYLQLDGLTDEVCGSLRGLPLLDTKLQAIERLGSYGINTTLVATLQAGVNEDQIGPLVEFARRRTWITGVSFQPASYVGRSALPSDLERRITFPDVIREVERQTSGLFAETDFFPVPCAHPNAHTLAYAFRNGEDVVPITRFVDIDKHFDLLANGISLTRDNTRQIVAELIERESCGPNCGCFGESEAFAATLPEPSIRNKQKSSRPASSQRNEVGNCEDANRFQSLAADFFRRALIEDLAAADMFRITTTSFMDAYNFDVRQIMKSCVHHLLPSGHLIPFCAYNLLYRNGRVPLPNLTTRPSRWTHRDSSSKPRHFALPVIEGVE